jgi:hypothetical protein
LQGERRTQGLPRPDPRQYFDPIVFDFHASAAAVALHAAPEVLVDVICG